MPLLPANHESLTTHLIPTFQKPGYICVASWLVRRIEFEDSPLPPQSRGELNRDPSACVRLAPLARQQLEDRWVHLVYMFVCLYLILVTFSNTKCGKFGVS